MDDVLSILQAPGGSATGPTSGSVRKPAGRLFSANQVALATFLGAPLAGSALFARNFQALGKGGTALLSLGLGAVATVVLILIALVLPRPVTSILPLLSVVGMRQLVNHYQGRPISDHEYAGGEKGSWFVSVAVGLAGFACVLVLIFVVAFVFVLADSAVR